MCRETLSQPKQQQQKKLENHHDQKHHGKGVEFTVKLAGASWPKLKQRPWKSVAYWPARLAFLGRPGPPAQG